MARNTDRTVRALVESYFVTFPDEAAKMLEALPASEVARLLETQSVAAGGRVLQRLTPDLAAEAIALLQDDSFQAIALTLETVRFASLLARLDPEVREARLNLLPAAD